MFLPEYDVYHISSKKVDHWRNQDPRYEANADRRVKYKEKTKLIFSSSSVGVFRPKKTPQFLQMNKIDLKVIVE